MIYDKIYEFCKVRNTGSVFSNGLEPSPRVLFILDLLTELEIPHELVEWKISEDTMAHNIIMKGRSNRIVTAHHDVANHRIDNANDNSASVINAIALKIECPEITVALLDGEEVGGLGSTHLAQMINDGELGEVEWILNLELTGKGGARFFIGNYPGKLSDHIRGIIDCPIFNTPFNDSVIFRSHGIDSVVINPIPILKEGTSKVKWGDEYLDVSILYNCHTYKDTLDSIDTKDMQEFVEKVLVPIVTKK